MKRQAGFTLIELVMVIVILGILSAFALPRFADLGSDARAAALAGAYGAVKSASSIAHADALVNNNATVTLEGTVIAMVDSYPAPTSAGIIAAAQIDANDFAIDTSVADTVTIGLDGGGATCEFSYAMASGDAAPTFTAPGTCN